MRNSPVAVSLCLLAALALFLPGINWGLPTRAVDPYLFGDQEPWSGEKIASLAPPDAGARGADVDANPLVLQTGPVAVNRDDAERAEILIRYRLYSYQPDEMITFRSLSRIKESRGDPRLYQYGGLWIYPVGALLQLGDIIGLVELRGDQAFYFDHPEAFGRFYVVARLYTVMWSLVATCAVLWIVRRLTGSSFIAATGAICFAAMPVVVNMAHEAKPHLPGLALTLLAAIAAAKYVDTGRVKWAMTSGVLCGAAFGMVISALLSFAIVPVMIYLRPARWRDRLALLVQSVAMGVVTYLLLNPFVLINALTDRDMLRSNLGNSTAMYRVSVGGVGNAVRLIVEGASPVIVIGGVIGLVVLLAARLRRRRLGCIDECPGRGDIGWLLLAPTLLVLLQFFLLADRKPAEYARFALLPDTFLLIAAFAAAALLRSASARATLAVAMMLLTLAFGVPYVAAFVRDSRPVTSRLAAAESIRRLAPQGTDIVTYADPAPYSMPPVDLFRNRLLVAPRGMAVDSAQALVVSVDEAASVAPISWADVRFEIVAPRPSATTTVSSP